MNIHVLNPQPTDPASLKPCAVINGTQSDTTMLNRAAGLLFKGHALHLGWAMRDYDEGWTPDYSRGGYQIVADELEARGVRRIPLAWSNPESFPDLQGAEIDYVNGLGRDADPRLAVIDPRSFDGHNEVPMSMSPPPPVTQAWLDAHPGPVLDQIQAVEQAWRGYACGIGYHAARFAWNEVEGGQYDRDWAYQCQPVIDLCDRHAVSTGGMSGGKTDWLTYDYNGWPVPQRLGLGSPQCYLAVGGAEQRLQTGNDPRWLAFLLDVDAEAARPGCVPVNTDPVQFSGVTAWHLGKRMAFGRALGRTDTMYWSQYANAGAADVAAALDMAMRETITPSLTRIGPIDLRATELTINGVHVTQAEYLSHFGT